MSTDLEHQLPKVLAVEQLHQRFRERLQPFHDIFLALERALRHPAAHFLAGSGEVGGVVHHHETFHARAIDQQ